MLKADRRFWRDLPALIVYLSIVAIGIAGSVSYGVRSWPSFLNIFVALLGVALLFFLFSGEIIRSVKSIRRLRLGERRRQAAAAGPQTVLIALPQPLLIPWALPLPFTIWFRPKGFAAGLEAVFVIILWVLVILWLRPLVIFGVLALLTSIPSWLSLYQRIEVSEEGMTVRFPFHSKTIRWQEARLFAVDVLAKGSQPADHYELSSEITILRWSRKLEPSRFTRLSSPFPEYAWQIDALLSLIAGKTGLQLYDLRDIVPVPPVLSLPER